MKTYILDGNTYSTKALAEKIGCSEVSIYNADKKARQRGDTSFSVKNSLVQFGEKVSKRNFYSSTNNNETVSDKVKQLEDAITKANNLKEELLEIMNNKVKPYKMIIGGFYAYKSIVNKDGETDDLDLKNKEHIIEFLKNMIKFDMDFTTSDPKRAIQYNEFEEIKADELVKLYYQNLSEFSTEDINNKINEIFDKG